MSHARFSRFSAKSRHDNTMQSRQGDPVYAALCRNALFYRGEQAPPFWRSFAGSLCIISIMGPLMSERTERIIELALTGEKTLAQIGEVVGLAGCTVGAIVRENGYTWQVRTAIRNKRIAHLWEDERKSLAYLSQLFRLKPHTVQNILNTEGLSLTQRKYRYTREQIVTMSRTGKYTITQLSALSGRCMESVAYIVGENRPNLGDELVCPCCHKRFTRTHYHQKYCPGCRSRTKLYESDLQVIRCDYCGLERQVRRRKQREHTFCCLEHRDLYFKRRQAIRNNRIRRNKARGFSFEEIARQENLTANTVRVICRKPMERVLRLPAKERLSPGWKSTATKARLRLEEKKIRESWGKERRWTNSKLSRSKKQAQK